MAGNCSRYIADTTVHHWSEVFSQKKSWAEQKNWNCKRTRTCHKGNDIKKDAKRITVNRSNSDYNYRAARYTYTVAGKEYCRKFSCSPLSSTRSHLRTIINVYWIDDPARPFWDYSEDPLGDLYNIFTTLFPWIVAILLILFLPGGADAVRQYQIPTISG